MKTKVNLLTYEDIGVELVSATNNPMRVIGQAMNLTVSKDFDDKTTSKQLKELLDMNIGTHTEHVSYTFLIRNASRSFLAQITRHRIASFTSGSQHYQNYSGYPCIVDPEITDKGSIAEIQDSIDFAFDTYNSLVKSGVPIYEARQVLPNGACNNLMVTMNVRSLTNFFMLRLCNVNTKEIKLVAGQMLKLVRFHFPEYFKYIGPPCFTKGKCDQGRRSCGEPWTQK